MQINEVREVLQAEEQPVQKSLGGGNMPFLGNKKWEFLECGK